jgi:hypothetical protein
MAWTDRSEEAALTLEEFAAIARQEGLDVNDEEHLRLLYSDALGVYRLMAELVATDVGSMEPLDVYSPPFGRA